ncbi:unnamed protein product [Clonostachys byssicola]|uniref:Zn(2)-C6 fungal-type domain-containing protein n=1 Tax=Clonostachys byssicola TaxID=160290 RepID=A0A9N9XZ78_9HYPO|nr:unnamed protein product [Clonostachys byssicola]
MVPGRLSIEPEGQPEVRPNGNAINNNNNTATVNSNEGSGAGPSEGQKRNGDELQSDSAVKRRASRACLSCRTRKVRCDVTNRGVPCTNCRLDTVECALTESWRGRVRRAPTTAHVAEARSTSSRSEHPDPPPQAHIQSQVHAHTNLYAQTNGSYPESAAEDFPVSLTFEGLRDVSDRNEDTLNRPDNDNAEASLASSALGALGTSSSAGPSPVGGNQGLTLPPYIRPLPPRLKAADLYYLMAKDALSIPDEELQRQLLRQYIEHVHPFMPILDLADFLLPIACRDGSSGSPVSLLLFQAVMFAGVAYIDFEYCTSRGFDHRKLMRKHFLDKVRVLYDLDTEPDRTARLQALLLMTYWYQRAEDEKDTWHWTGIALSQIYMMGIHRDPNQLDVPPKVIRRRKRIWWACYVRDRLIALGIRRPARIRASDFDVPKLTLEDCELEPLDATVVSFLGHLPVVDATTQRDLMRCFIDLTKLGDHIGDILSTQYTTVGTNTYKFKTEDRMTMMVVPQRSAQQMEDMTKCVAKLDTWRQNMHSSSRYRPSRPHSDHFHEPTELETHPVVNLHQAMIYMIYLTATAILHRPRAQHEQSRGDGISDGNVMNVSTTSPRLGPGTANRASTDTSTGSLTSSSAEKIADAAAGITEIAYDLHYGRHGNQLRFASTSAIPALLSAILIHLNEISSSKKDPVRRYVAIGRFYQCWQALQYLRDMYASADHVVWFLEAVIEKTNVEIPMLNLATTSHASTPDSRRLPLAKTTAHPASHQRTNAPTGISGLGEQVGRNAMITPVTLDDLPTSGSQSNGVYDMRGDCFPRRPPAFQSPFSQPQASMQVGDHPVVSDPHDAWTIFDDEDNLLQALVHFDADPNFFPASGF